MNSDIKRIKKFVRYIRFHLIKRKLLKDSCVIISVFFFFSTVLGIIFSLFPWIVIPPVWDIAVCSVFLLIAWRVSDLIWLHPLKLLDVAQLIDQRSGQPHMVISIALELELSEINNSFSTKTYMLAVEQIDKISIKNILPPQSTLPSIFLSVGLIVWLGTLVRIKPAIVEYWDLPFTLLKKPAVSVFPGTTRVPFGSNVTLKLLSKDNVLPSARLTCWSNERLKKSIVLLQPDSRGVFKYDIDSITEPVYYQFDYGGNIFAEESIIVVPPPSITGLSLIIQPPEYTGLPSRIVNDGRRTITIADGSKLTVVLNSPELVSAKMILKSDSLLMDIQHDSATVSLVVKESLDYTFVLTNEFGVLSDSLPLFHIEVLSDEKPFVQIVRPGYDKVLAPAQIETLWIESVDDFGIRSMYLLGYTNRVSDQKVLIKDIQVKEMSPVNRNEVVWDIREQSLYPGDTMYYWVKVRDSYPFAVQESVSDTFTFRLPGFEEIYKSVMDYGEYASQKIAEVRNKQKNIQEKIENVLKNSIEKNEFTWEQNHMVNEIEDELTGQADSLQKAIASLEKSVAEMKKEGALSDDISKKMDDVRKALEDLIAQFADSLVTVEAGDPEISIEEMHEAIKKAQEMLPELNDRLENTLRFLEQLKKDHELAMLALQSEKLAEEQLNIIENSSLRALIESQKNLQDRITSFVDTLNKKVENHSSLNTALKDVHTYNNRISSEMNTGSKPKSQDMTGLSNSLINVAKQLRMSMSSQRKKQIEELREALLNLTGDLLNFASWTDLVEHEIINSNAQKAVLSQQVLIESIKKVSKKIDSLKTLPPFVLQSLREDFQALEYSANQALFAIGNQDSVHLLQRIMQRLELLQNSILSIVESMSDQEQQNDSGGEAGDLIEELRALSGKQSTLNSAVSDLLRSMISGGREGGVRNQKNIINDSKAEAQLEAKNKQAAIADQLNEIVKKFKEKDINDASMSMRIKELEKEARVLSQMLERSITQETIKRQDVLLSRMLQATLSMHRLDDEKDDRKSESSQELFSRPLLESYSVEVNKPDSFYTIRQKAFQGNFPESYRSVIRTYFDSLGVLYLKDKK